MGRHAARGRLGALAPASVHDRRQSQSAWSFGPYLVAVVAISVIVTPMFNAAGGSILIAALFHFQVNNPATGPTLSRGTPSSSSRPP